MPDPDPPAALVSTRIVPANLVDQFHEWADALDRSAQTATGHRASLRLEQAGGLFHLIHWFDDAPARDAWARSDAFIGLQDAAQAFPLERRQSADGPIAHLVVPSESAASRWKTFVATWLAVFPILLALSTAVRAVAGGLPQPVQLLFSSLMLTGLLQFVVMPRVQRLVRPWALADADGQARADRA